MNVQGTFRGAVVGMALGFALLLASPVRAQQEMNPDTFDINPGAPAELASAKQVVAPNVIQESVAQASIEPASNWDGVFGAPMNAVDVTMVVILAVGTVLVTLFTLVATRRRRRPLPAVQDSAYAQSSGATTH